MEEEIALDAFMVGMFWVLVLALPLLQIGAGILSALVIGVAPANVFPSKREALGAVGRITLTSFVGALGGTIVMCGLAGALGAF
jgi:hypothetical protein